MLDSRDLKVLETLLKHPSGIPLTGIHAKAGVPKRTVEGHLPLLLQEGLVRLENVPYRRPKPTPQKEMRPYYMKRVFVTEQGKEAYAKATSADEVRRLLVNIYETTRIEEKTTITRELFTRLFEFTYDEFYRLGKVDRYMQLLRAIEDPARERLNRDASDHLQRIKRGGRGGVYYDPYFIIDPLLLPGLYRDAKRAKELGHYLWPNHVEVFTRSGDFTKQELTEHNRQWDNRPENKLDPLGVVRLELETRRREFRESKESLDEEIKGFYEHFERPRRFARNDYQRDEKGPI